MTMTAGARAWLGALAVAVLALTMSLGVAHATRPPGYFTKYIAAASPSHDPSRDADYSPLYLALARLLVPHQGATSLLLLNCLLHACLCVLVYATVRSLAPPAAGLAAGVIAATYRPFLVYCGVLEPEIVLAASLALAIAAGVAARARLAGGRRGALFLSVVGGAALGAAALCRPPSLLLVPVWAWWLAAAAPRGGRRRAAAAVLLAGLAPPLSVALARTLEFGSPVLMDPGAVLYEGNAPPAVGGTNWQGALLLDVERANPDDADYGHVVYRRIASAVLGAPATPFTANRYWTALALEGMQAHPTAALERILAKLPRALGPHESYDLPEAYELDRRLRCLLPWGFGVLLAALPLLMLQRGERIVGLAGPLALAAVSLAAQLALYASGRQRLPLALALVFVAPVLVAACSRSSWRRPAPSLAVVTGGVAWMAFAYWAAPRSAYLEYRMESDLGGTRESLGERLSALADGRAFAPRIAGMAFAIDTAAAQCQAGACASAARALTRVTSGESDMPNWLAARADYWLARARLAGGDTRAAELALARSRELFSTDLASNALAAVLGAHEEPIALALHWRPAGIDPLTARYALAEATEAVYGRQAAAAVAARLLGPFPELARVMLCLQPR